MAIRNTLIALAAAGMVLGSTAAAAAPAVGDVRAGSPVADAEGIRASPWTWILALIIIAAIIGVIAADTEDTSPASP
jgi:hypothetical protein